jgi:PAS domain S-box-containing protein
VAPWVVLAVCLAATAVLWQEARRGLELRAAGRLERATRQVRAALASRVRSNEDLARAAAGFCVRGEEVSPAEFRRFAGQLDYAKRDPAFVSLAFIEPVHAADIPAWIEARRRAGSAVDVRKADETGDSCLIRLFEPDPAVGTAVGLNACANALNRAALDAARKSGEARIAGPLPLGSFPADRGLALQSPVFLSGSVGREFRGWMSLMVRVRPLMEEALVGMDPEVGVTLLDGSDASSPLFVSDGKVGDWPEPVRVSVTLADHFFTLVVSPRSGYATSLEAVRPRMTLAAGICISALLFGIVQSLATTRRRAASLAEEMTRSLHESERRYQILFEQNLAGIYRTTTGGRILDCNEAFARIFGYGSRKEMLDDTAISLWERPADRAAFVEEIRAKGALLHYEHRYVRRDGKPVWTLEYVAYREGDPPLLEGTILDVTDTRRALEALRESEERYRGIFREFRDGIFLFDPATKALLDSNPSFDRLLGLTAEELRSLSLYDIVADDRSMVDANAARAAVEPFLHVGERRYRRKGGGLVSVDVESFRFDEGGRPVVFVLVKNLAERRLLEDQLRQAQKMEAVGRLAGGVAHDFNNLLTAILGYSDLVLAGEPPEDIRANVEEVHKAADRAASLTRQLLAFSRKQVLQPRILELNDVAKNLDAMLHRVLRENVKIAHEPDPHLWRVKADPGQVEQVLMNLAVNASDAMPEGGTLAIRTRNVTLASGEIGGIPMQSGDYVLLEVVDTGCGMDPDTLAHAFEPFFTTKEHGKGTGLGLATVYGIVKQSGGYIQALSEEGKGTTFRIYLPRVHGAADSPSNISPRPSPVRGDETILLVEDEDAVRRLAQTVLRARGYQVLAAETAEAALELSRAHPDRIHLLLTDVVLPGMNGRRLAETLKAERPGLAVLLCSGYFDAREGVEENDPLLRKPFTPDGLVERVRSILRRARAPASGARLP